MARGTIHCITVGLITVLSGYVICNECPSYDNDSVLQPGKEYAYHFKSEAFGEAVGTTDDRSRMILECSIKISHDYDCFYTLLMKHCSLSASGGPPGSETAWLADKELPDISKYPVKFTMIHGAVEDVFKDEDDPIFYVNIKRAALSAFVFKLTASSERKHEVITDIHGTCPLEIVSVSDDSVKTSKNMMLCAYPSRTDWQFSPWSIFWNMSFIQYLINSTVNCEYKVDFNGKEINNVYCKERHAIGLESTHRTTTAVQTNIYYQMTLVKSEKMKSSSKKTALPGVHTGIQFEYERTPDPKPESEPKDFLPVAQKMLLELVETSQDEIRLFTIPKFTDFVGWLRTSYDLTTFVESVMDLSFLEKKVPSSESIKDLSMAYLSDALVQCQTVPCIKAISELAAKEALSDLYLNFVLYSWNNMHFTKPEVIGHITKMCETKDTRFCWLSLGTIVKRYHRTTFSKSHEKANEVKQVLNHFSNNIGKTCEPPYSFATEQEKNEHLLTYLKAIGNTGETYLKYLPRGIFPLLKCVTKEDLPMFIRTSVVEVLHQLDVCAHSVASCSAIYDELIPILHDASISVDLRIAVYMQLMNGPDKYSFEQDLITLLKNEKNSQILSYVASDLLNRISDAEYRKAHPYFIDAITKQLEQNNVLLESFISFEDGKSESYAYGHFTEYPLFPKNLQGFGAKFYSSVIYPFYNRLPQRFRSSIVMQLFSKIIDLLTIGGHIEGWQDVDIIVQKIMEDIASKPVSSEELSKILSDLVLALTPQDSESQGHFKFDKTIVNSIKDIHSAYQKHRFLPNPFFDVYFQMFGSTLNFVTFDDVLGLNSIADNFNGFMAKLQNGIVFNNTRVIRVIEAYHQVPTMMGLPLNWTTNATLAFSVRRGLQLNFGENQQVHASGFIQPSAALTFLNRMVLDFPTFTQIGIQANSSGYTSTQFRATLDLSDNQKIIKVEAPQKPQKILELFRTNQIIKDNNYEDILDWDIKRTSASWCLDDKISSVFGLKICHERSYPNVTHLIKPWALMAGWCKWQLEVLPHDRELKSYNFEFVELPSGDYEKKIELKLSAPGTAIKREVLFDILLNLKSGELRSNMRIPDLPDFFLSVTRNSMFEDNKFVGFWDVGLLQISESLKYKLTQNQEIRVEERKEDSTGENVSPKLRTIPATVVQKNVKLETPFNYYSWSRRTYLQDENVKVDISAAYENREPQWNFLSKILPLTFWENESKASIRLLFNWKVSSIKPKETAIQYVTAHISTPKSNLDLLSNTLRMTGREQFNVNITKSDVASGKLMSFANFTYDSWSSESSGQNMKEIKLINFTIPRRSWCVQIKRGIEDNKQLYSVIVSRAKMVPKAGVQNNAANYVGWWSQDVKHLFDLQQMEFKLSADIESRYPDNPKILSEFNNIQEEEIRNLKSKYIKANVVFSYPFSNKEEFMKFNGKFLLSGVPTVFRFQKDFVLLSTYNNLQLNSHSVYFSREGKSVQLSHNSFFTHTASETKAYYNMDFKQFVNDDACMSIDFNHNISSHVYNMASNVSYACNSENTKLHTLILNLDSSSPYWKVLDMQIRQIIEDISPTYSQESMNFTNPNMMINVTADWDRNYHKKSAIFTRIPENVPVMKVNVHSTRPLEFQLELVLPNEETDTKLFYHRQLSDDYKKLQARLYFPDIEHPIVHVHGIIQNTEYRLWKVDLFPSLPQFIKFVNDYAKGISVALKSIAEDSDHPLNRMLEPALKVSLAQYLSELGNYVDSGVSLLTANLKEAIISLKPFFDPSVSVITNIYHAVATKISEIYSVIEEKSIGVWAIKYFQVPQLLQEKLQNMPSVTSLLQAMIFSYNQSEKTENYYPIQSFVFRTGRLLKWRYFNEMPSLAAEKLQFFLPNQIMESQREILPHHKQASGSKIAMIFGPRHVYTFDGLLYEFPKYPSEYCAFLLAHDVLRSKYSAIATAEFIHLLFPEIAISINAKDEVYIDGSYVPQALPFQSSNGTIAIRREGNVLVVWSPSLTVLCQGESFLCTLEINAWNTGSTIGLLGNADGETYNDFMLPDGRTASDVLELAHSYELSGNSKCKNLKIESKRLPEDIHKERCSEAMNKVCSFYDHLQQHFLEPCVTYLKEEDNMCYTETALSALCFHKQQPMQSECNLSPRKKEKTHTKQRLEIVLIVNEHQSMLPDRTSNLRKGIESIIHAVQKQFDSHGYSTILFSLIGFGGEGVRYYPSVHAVGSNIWLTHKEAIRDLLPTLEFSGASKLNPVSAVKYAAEVLGYNTFDKKVFIVITDEDTLESYKSELNLVQSYLDKNHITLYTIASYPSIEKGKKVFGVRADGLIFPTASKGEDFLDYPRGTLAKLTSGTRGSLFLKKYVDSNAPSSYFTVFAQEVWAKVRKEVGFCRVCKSVRSGWWYFQYECHLVDCRGFDES